MLHKLTISLVSLFFFSFFFACSEDSSSGPNLDESLSEILSSSASTPSSSSNKSSGGSSSSKKQLTVYDTLMVADSTYDIPYYSEDSSAFNWDIPMSVEASSSSSTPPQSSATTKPVESSSSANVALPVIQGDSLIDTRDGNVYHLAMVGQTIWMIENINYETPTGSMCYGETDCSRGSLYVFSALKSVCPEGWRLPSREEFEAASADTEYPWSYGGRMKDNSYSFQGDMGFYWLETSATLQEGDEDNCSDSDCAMIYVQKAPDYGGGESLFQRDSQNKGFSVRCVKK